MGSFVDHQDLGSQIIGDSFSQDAAEKTGAHDEVIMFQFAHYKVFDRYDLSV